MSAREAVVVGASMAGLLAARVLSESYGRVTVLDRDYLPESAVPRRGVPQSRQVHILLARGAEILEELFPGIGDELLAAGAISGDLQLKMKYVVDGRPLAAAPSGVFTLSVSRPLLEHLVRRRVRQLPNVEIADATEALGLLASRDLAAVIGVRTSDPGRPRLKADLVVDTAGRGSRARDWLRELGWPEPESTRVRAGVVYVTRFYKWAPQHLGGNDGLVVVPFPGSPRGYSAVRVEGDRWATILYGLLGEEPPTDEAGMRAFADSLPVADPGRLMREAEPLGDAVKMRYPESVRWHFDRQRRHPSGFLVAGDALCSFNPTYGQGMSVAAMQAMVLRGLASSAPDDLPRRFFQAAAQTIEGAWAMAAGSDLRFPEIAGRRGVTDRLLGSYLDRYRLAASADPVLARKFLRVTNMLDPATALLSPAAVLKVFGGKRARTRKLG